MLALIFVFGVEHDPALIAYVDGCLKRKAAALAKIKAEIGELNDKYRQGKPAAYIVGSEAQTSPKSPSKDLKDKLRQLGNERDHIQKATTHFHERLPISWIDPNENENLIGLLPDHPDPWHVAQIVGSTKMVVCKKSPRILLENEPERGFGPSGTKDALKYFTSVDGIETAKFKPGENIQLPEVFRAIGTTEFLDDKGRNRTIPRIRCIQNEFQACVKARARLPQPKEVEVSDPTAGGGRGGKGGKKGKGKG